MAASPSELTVRSESVQRLYGLYLADRFQVNRRYQRKLVWTVEEKQRLVDSLLRDLPVPLFLVAELELDGQQMYELIDGMQRLNAIFGFLENEFRVDGTYFDLDALADTKLRKDSGFLTQRTPVMNREHSAAIANYTIALSVYRAEDNESVDEVFRRINSGGRSLSRQGLRQAGTLSTLADLVRTTSALVRGDTSPGDVLPLSVMPNLSVTNYELAYGVDVEDIFWVREGILRREDVRESLDEQLVLDLLIDCLIDPLGNSGTRIRDAYYDYVPDGGAGPTQQSQEIATAVEAYGQTTVRDHFMKTYDEIRMVLQGQEQRFSNLLQAGSGGRAPRYFHVVFMAFYELMFRERMRIRDHAEIARVLVGLGSRMGIPGGGGDWQREAKRTSFNTVKGVIRPYFEGPIEGEDFGRYGLQSQLETLLGNALVEQQLFDCKQGFYDLTDDRQLDGHSLHKIARTMTAMANMGPRSTGYVVVGIADSDSDAARIANLDHVEPFSYRGFRIVGIDREVRIAGTDLNTYWHDIVGKIARSMPVELASSIGENARLVNYRGRCVVVLRVSAASAPVFFDGELYIRRGSDTVQVRREDYMDIYNRFAASS